MKNGNLYKVMAMMMALVFISALSFAQETDKKEKKTKKMMINIEVDDDGNTTTIDTIIFYNHDDVDVDVILKEIRLDMDIEQENMEEIMVVVMDEMKDAHHNIKIELIEQHEDLQKAFDDLQKEFANLEIEEDVRQRIEEAMHKLEEVDWDAHAVNMKHAMIDAHHMVFETDEHETVEIIIDGNDTTHVTTKMLWVTDDNNKKPSDQNMNVWVTEEDGKKIIIKTSTDSENNEYYFNDDKHGKHSKHSRIMVIGDSDDAMHSHMMFGTARAEDFEKAKNAGLKIDADKKLEINNINIELKDDKGVIELQTSETAKMKVSFYDKDFNKIKQIKAEEKNGTYEFPFIMDELKKDGVKYILIEQNKKSELMKL